MGIINKMNSMTSGQDTLAMWLGPIASDTTKLMHAAIISATHIAKIPSVSVLGSLTRRQLSSSSEIVSSVGGGPKRNLGICVSELMADGPRLAVRVAVLGLNVFNESHAPLLHPHPPQRQAAPSGAQIQAGESVGQRFAGRNYPTQRFSSLLFRL